jgi:ribosomal protein S6E (S10)
LGSPARTPEAGQEQSTESKESPQSDLKTQRKSQIGAKQDGTITIEYTTVKKVKIQGGVAK